MNSNNIDPFALDNSLSADERRLYSHAFRVGDIGNKGHQTAMEAAALWKKSHIPDGPLGQIWQMVDKDMSGNVGAKGFTQAMRLIACVQQNRPLDRTLMLKSANPIVKLEGIDLPASQSTPTGNDSLTNVQPSDRARYAEMFSRSAPTGQMDAQTARNIFIQSRLPDDFLAKVWALVVVDARNPKSTISVNDFCIAMNIISRRLANPSLILPGSLSVSAGVPLTPLSNSGMLGGGGGNDFGGRVSSSALSDDGQWTIPHEERVKYDSFFSSLDLQKREYLGGDQAAPFFMKSGLPEAVLSSIWSLIDTDKSGKISRDKFAAAMYMIHKKLAGAPLPQVLPASLLSGSSRQPLSASVGGSLSRPMSGLQAPLMASSSMSSTPMSASFSSQQPMAVSPALQDARNLNSNLQQQLAASQLQNTQTQAQLAAVQQEITELNSKNSALEEQLKSAKDGVAGHVSKLAQIRGERDDEQKKFLSLQQDYTAASQELSTLKTRLELEGREVEQLKSRNEDGQKWVQGQKDELTQAQASLEELLKSKELAQSEFLKAKSDYEELTVKVSTVRDEVAAAISSIAQLKLDIKAQEEKNRVAQAELLNMEKEKLNAQQSEAKLKHEKAEKEAAKPVLATSPRSNQSSSKSPVSKAAVLDDDVFEAAPKSSNPLPVLSPMDDDMFSPLSKKSEPSTATKNIFGDDDFGIKATTTASLPNSPSKSLAQPIVDDILFGDAKSDSGSFKSASVFSPSTGFDEPVVEKKAPVALSQEDDPFGATPAQPLAEVQEGDPFGGDDDFSQSKISPKVDDAFESKAMEQQFTDKFPTVDSFESSFPASVPAEHPLTPSSMTNSPSSQFKPAEVAAAEKPVEKPKEKSPFDDFDDFKAVETASDFVPAAAADVDFDAQFESFFDKPTEKKDVAPSVVSEPTSSPIVKANFAVNFDDANPFGSAAKAKVKSVTGDDPFSAFAMPASDTAVQSSVDPFGSGGDPFGTSKPASNDFSAFAQSSTLDFDAFGTVAPAANQSTTFGAIDFGAFESTKKPAIADDFDAFGAFGTALNVVDNSFGAGTGTSADPFEVTSKTSAGEKPPIYKSDGDAIDVSAGMKEVMAMGFSKEQAEHSLLVHGGDVQKAINHLLDDASKSGNEESSPRASREITSSKGDLERRNSVNSAVTTGSKSTSDKKKWWSLRKGSKSAQDRKPSDGDLEPRTP
eukprot:Partr_v1_DN28807_c1_g1_i3_m33683 putative Epidermal growth factor receptor pathway substrate